MIPTHEGRSYQPRSVMVGGRRRVDFVLTCGECGAEDAIHLTPDCPPEQILQKFERRGWLTNPVNDRWCRCPTCNKRSKEKQVTTKPDLSIVKPAEPTLEQVGKIATELRGCFDDEKGCYLDGFTDQRVGETLGIAWGIVAKVRDALGLKIKIDPELERVKADLGAAEGIIADLRRRVETVEKRMAK